MLSADAAIDSDTPILIWRGLFSSGAAFAIGLDHAQQKPLVSGQNSPDDRRDDQDAIDRTEIARAESRSRRSWPDLIEAIPALDYAKWTAGQIEQVSRPEARIGCEAESKIGWGPPLQNDLCEALPIVKPRGPRSSQACAFQLRAKRPRHPEEFENCRVRVSRGVDIGHILPYLSDFRLDKVGAFDDELDVF